MRGLWRRQPGLVGSAIALAILACMQLLVAPVPWWIWAPWGTMTIVSIATSLRTWYLDRHMSQWLPEDHSD